MKKAEEQRQALLAMTIEAAAQRGLGEFSLRHLASTAGSSTTAIFQNFSGKAELLENAVELAIARDRAFHDALLERAAGLLSTHIGFADFLTHYVMQRPALAQARFLSEMLLALDDYPQCREQLHQWNMLRTAFWTEVLAKLDVRAGMASIVAQFVVMEEFYAYALEKDCVYGMLLSETCRAVCEADFHGGSFVPAQSHVSLRLGTEPLSLRESDEPDDPDDASVREKLIDEALRIIDHSGLQALSQRRIAKHAGVSASAITYYFKDMKTFKTRAIWRALMVGVPGSLDPEKPQTEQPQDLSNWLQTLSSMLEPGLNGGAPGFYIGAARLTAQACLQSRHDEALVPLIAYLRELDGWGTYRVSRRIAPLAPLIRRDHAAAFGVWIKAEAILLRVDLAKPGTKVGRLELAARHIFPER